MEEDTGGQHGDPGAGAVPLATGTWVVIPVHVPMMSGVVPVGLSKVIGPAVAPLPFGEKADVAAV